MPFLIFRKCSTYRGKERCIKGFGGKTYGKETTGRMMLKPLLRNRVGGVGVVWIDLAPGRKR
jgi:hypothetical protein